MDKLILKSISVSINILYIIYFNKTFHNIPSNHLIQLIKLILKEFTLIKIQNVELKISIAFKNTLIDEQHDFQKSRSTKSD